jgi:hypothetical protein
VFSIRVQTGSALVSAVNVRRDVVPRCQSAGVWVIWWIRADGVGEAQRLIENRGSLGDIQATAMSPDGRRLIYGAEDPVTHSDLWMLPLDITDPDHPKPGQPEPFLRTPFTEDEPTRCAMSRFC